MKYRVKWDAIDVNELCINDMEIVLDQDNIDQIEIYLLDSAGTRIEGGGFNRQAFLDHVYEFYKKEMQC